MNTIPNGGTLNGWENLDPVDYFQGQVTSTNVAIDTYTGQYVVSFSPEFTHTTPTNFTAQIMLNGKAVVTGRYSSVTRITVPLSLNLKLKVGDKLSFDVRGPVGVVSTGTTRSLVFMAPIYAFSGGVSIYCKTSTSFSGKSGTVGNFMADGEGYFMENNATLVNNEGLAILKPGFYRINAHIIVQNTGAMSRYLFGSFSFASMYHVKQ